MNREFELYAVNDEGLEKLKEVASSFDTLLNNLIKIWQKENRLTDLARNKLEEACFFTKKAVASNFIK